MGRGGGRGGGRRGPAGRGRAPDDPLAVEQRAQGLFNVVDDEPAPAGAWLPHLATCAGGKPPLRVPVRLARLLAGDVAVTMTTEGRGFANTKTRKVLGWRPRYASWREGFREGLR